MWVWIVAILGLLVIGTKTRGHAEGRKIVTKFNMNVESWRAILLKVLRDGEPINFYLSWMDAESNGNPCATGFVGQKFSDGKFKFEAGIGQNYFEANSAEELFDKTTYGGVKLRTLRAACSQPTPGKNGTGQTLLRPLTDEEVAANVTSFVEMVRSKAQKLRERLGKAGVTWSGQDFWSGVKLYHNLPGIPDSFLGPAAKAGLASNFKVFETFVNALTPDQYKTYTTAAGYGRSMAGFSQQRVAQLLAKAWEVGSVT